MSAGGSTKVIVIALGANLGIAASKFVGAFVSGSASLLAEAIHSLVDSTNQGLLLLGANRAKRPPSASHPLGHGREAFFWSFVVALLLFSLGGAFAIYEGVHKFSHPEPVSSPLVGLAILVAAVILESVSFRAALREARAQNPYGSLWKWLRKTTSSELLVVFTEDAAALLGLVIALAALLAAWATGDSRWDAAGSIAVGVALVLVAAFLAVEIKSLIVGEASSTDYEPVLNEIVAKKIPGGRVLRVIALQVGANETMLAYKVSTGSMTEVARLIEALNAIEAELKASRPEVSWQFAEPDCEA